MAETLDEKIYYKIGEACKVLDIQPYVLRYWETEFPSLAPSKSRSGQRVYTQRELTVIRRIKELLYDEGYTIAGAKKRLEAELEGDGEPAGEGPVETAGGPASEDRVTELRRGLEHALAEARELLAILDGDDADDSGRNGGDEPAD